MAVMLRSAIDEFVEGVRFDESGLVAVITRDASDGEVLMLAYMNAVTLRETLNTGIMTYWSRSRREVWVKGATSGHFQYVQDARLDCDSDALLFDVIQVGDVACHTGRRSCFFKEVPFVRAEPPEVTSGRSDEGHRRPA